MISHVMAIPFEMCGSSNRGLLIGGTSNIIITSGESTAGSTSTSTVPSPVQQDPTATTAKPRLTLMLSQRQEEGRGK